MSEMLDTVFGGTKTADTPVAANPLIDSDKTAISRTETQIVRTDGRPDPQIVRGRCPECGDELVSNFYYTRDQGYLMVWECWGSLGEDTQCNYRRVL